MTRFRKTAVAAVAVSALLVAPTAAYAHDGHHGVSASTKFSGMRWAHYSGDLIDYTQPPNPPAPDKEDTFQGAKAYAFMMGLEGRSVFRLRVTGIRASDGTYGVHLHQGTCVADNFDAAEGHYQVNWDAVGDLRDREVWLDLDVNSEGNARSTATVDFIPDGPRSIVLHALPTNPSDGKAGGRLACLPFTIKSLPSGS